ERCIQGGLRIGVDRPNTVWSDHPHAIVPTDAQQVCLAALAVGTDLAEARRKHDQGVNAFAPTLLGDLQDVRRGHGDDCQIEGTLDVLDAAKGWQRLNGATARIDRVYR